MKSQHEEDNKTVVQTSKLEETLEFLRKEAKVRLRTLEAQKQKPSSSHRGKWEKSRDKPNKRSNVKDRSGDTSRDKNNHKKMPFGRLQAKKEKQATMLQSGKEESEDPSNH